MIVFSCEFPLNHQKSDEDILGVLSKWITGSPNYPWGPQAILQRPSIDEPITEICKDGHRLYLANIQAGDLHLCGIRYAFSENGRFEWTTEISASHGPGVLWITVKIFCDLVTPGGDIPSVKKPYVIGLLIKGLGGGCDGPFTVSECPYFLKTTDVDLAERIVVGTVNCSMPVVYVSSDMNGRMGVDAVTLARWLSGIAHVVVEPNRRFSVDLSKKVENINCYGGAVGIYWPNGGGKPIKIMPWKYGRPEETLSEITKIVRGSLLYSKTKNGVTWLNIKDHCFAKKLNDLKGKQSGEVEQYISVFDEQMDNMRKQLDQASGHNASLQTALHSANAKLARLGGGVLRPGKEPEFYPGEMSDALIASIEKSKAHIGEGTRHRMLIDDILAVNTKSDNGDKIEKAIKEALSEKMKITTKEIKVLEDVGFTVTDGGKHYRAVFNGDERFHFTLFNTASDHRTGKNLASTIISKLLIR